MTTYRTETGYLVIRSDGTMRVLKGRYGTVELGYDEVAFKVKARIPEVWGSLVGTVELEVPEGSVNLDEVALLESPKPEDEEAPE